MFRKSCVFAALLLPWLASAAGADCSPPEYRDSRAFIAPCKALGIPLYEQSESQFCTKERLEIAKSDIDWVLFGNAAALEAYRASVKEQRDCGFSLTPVTRNRALWVAVKAHDPLAQCMLIACEWTLGRYMADLEVQGKMPKE